MPRSSTGNRYKEIRFQQLRSFAETAKHGSLAGAATALGVAQPTVWAQVHALQRSLKTKLIEPHGRGCRLTDEGKLLAELAGPLVAGFDSLVRSFQEQKGQIEPRLIVAAPQRILVEELTAAIYEFDRRFPHVRLSLLERMSGTVSQAVENGEADIGISAERDAGEVNPRLHYEPAYELDILLITPKDHSLARRKRIGLKDLCSFPLVNAINGFPSSEIAVTLDKLGAFQVQPRRVEAVNTPVIRRYVEMGFGIGLIVGRVGAINTSLHEQSINQLFGTTQINLIWRKGALQSTHARDFADTVKAVLCKAQK